MRTRMLYFIAMLLLTVPALISAQAGACQQFPGATANDLLTLITRHVNDGNVTTPAAGTNKAVLTHGLAAIVTVFPGNVLSVTRETMVRRALAALGPCALTHRGSISGSYTDTDGTKTCFLFPGREGYCSL